METSYLDSDVDRLSELPSNVLVNVLSCLPLKDAVRTSTLSNNWKKKWHAMPCITVKESSFNQVQLREIEGIISYILTQHEGNIEKCSICVNRVSDCYNMKSWILRLSQKCIQDLTLKAKFYNRNEVPCDLFCCEQLRKLKLRNLEFKPPHSFKGFPSLISLRLSRITIATAELESLIASCPLLKRLTLKNSSCVDHLRIKNAVLKYFQFDGEFKSISFDTPFLTVLSLNLYRFGYKRSEFDLRFKICGLPPSIEKLYIRCEFNKFLASGNGVMDSSSCIHLKTLKLDKFCFEKLYEISSLLSLIGRFPNLQVLDISACDCDLENDAPTESISKFWEKKMVLPSCLEQLRNVKVRSFQGEDPELRFIEFVLGSSPLLKEVIIEAEDELDSDVMGQLNRFRRSSPEVVVKGIQSQKTKKTLSNTNAGARVPPPGPGVPHMGHMGPPGPPLGPQHFPQPWAMPPPPSASMMNAGIVDDFSSSDSE